MRSDCLDQNVFLRLELSDPHDSDPWWPSLDLESSPYKSFDPVTNDISFRF